MDGVQGMTDDRHWLAPRYAIGCALRQLWDAVQTFDRRGRAVGMPYHSWSFLAIYSPEHDDYSCLRMTKIALPNLELGAPVAALFGGHQWLRHANVMN